MEKEYALRILHNIKSRIEESTYFEHKINLCRNIDKIRKGIKNGFN